MTDIVPGAVTAFGDRTGGYINYQSSRSTNNGGDLRGLTEEQAEAMLSDANKWIKSYFPWMKDFVVFQLDDGTIRLDVADRQFLFDD